jgi:hypothetical protein
MEPRRRFPPGLRTDLGVGHRLQERLDIVDVIASRLSTRTTPSTPWTARTRSGMTLRRSTWPCSTTTPSSTWMKNRLGPILNSPPMTSSMISRRMAWSGRLKTFKRSLRLTIPTSRPRSPITGSRLMLARCMRRAASATVASGEMDTSATDMRSRAVAPAAFSRSRRRRFVQSNGRSWSGSGNSSFRSRSASETTPSTRRASSTTGTALTRCLASRATRSLNGVAGPTVTTWVVIRSLTRLCIGSSSFAC